MDSLHLAQNSDTIPTRKCQGRDDGEPDPTPVEGDAF
jgi:hypothetical protein